MKKTILAIVIIILILPSAVFAKGPTEIEVQETTTVVLSTFGLIFMTSMFGGIPEGVELQTEDISAGATIVFDNFDTKSYYLMLSDSGTAGAMDELPPVNFSRMSGSISVDENGDMNMDVKLEGGNIKTLLLRTSGEDLAELTVNGKDYSYLEDFFAEE